MKKKACKPNDNKIGERYLGKLGYHNPTQYETNNLFFPCSVEHREMQTVSLSISDPPPPV
jgi:hypothetical protein